MSEHCCNHGHVEGRATLDHQKKEVIQKILHVWLTTPQLRLGQLLVNAMQDHDNGHFNLFNIEDYDLMDLVLEFHNKRNPPIDPQITVQICK